MRQNATIYTFLIIFLLVIFSGLKPVQANSFQKQNNNLEVSFLEPANGAEGIFPGKAFLQIGFSEKILTNHLSLQIYDDESNKLLSTTLLSDSTNVQVEGNNIFIQPEIYLLPNTKYYIVIEPEAITNINKTKAFKGITRNTEWCFTTGSDSQNPYFMRVLPIVKESDYNRFNFETALNEPAQIYYTITETYQAIPTPEQIINGKNVNNIKAIKSAIVNYKKDILSVTVDGLKEGNNYTLNLVAKDLSGNISSVWQEAIYMQKNRKEKIVLEYTSPLNSSEAVSINTNFEMYFSEGIKNGDGKISIYEKKNRLLKETIFSENWQIQGSKLSFNLSQPLDTLSQYFIQIDSGAIISLNNKKAYKGINDTTCWNFITNDGTDNQAPKFSNNTPFLLNTSINTIELLVALNEVGKIYYIALPNDTLQKFPTAKQVMKGYDTYDKPATYAGEIKILDIDANQLIKIENLQKAIGYRIFLLAVDLKGNHKKYPYEIVWFHPEQSVLPSNSLKIQH